MDNSCFWVNIGSRKIFLCIFVFPFFPSLSPSLKKLQPSWERKRRRRRRAVTQNFDDRETSEIRKIESWEKFQKTRPFFVCGNGVFLRTSFSPNLCVFLVAVSLVMWSGFCFFLFSFFLMCNSSRRGRGIRERKENCMNVESEKACARMISDGYYTSKKSDEICEDDCDEVCCFFLLFNPF